MLRALVSYDYNAYSANFEPQGTSSNVCTRMFVMNRLNTVSFAYLTMYVLLAACIKDTMFSTDTD